jgi:ferritin-like metal-binding protein YciE
LIPADIPAAIFVVVHTSPSGPYRLREVLQRGTELQVSAIEDKLPIRYGRIYIARPDLHLLLEREQIHLLEQEADTIRNLLFKRTQKHQTDRCQSWKTAGWHLVIRPRDALVNGFIFGRDPFCFCRANLGQMQLHTLEDLYIHELKDLYSAEKQLIRALPKMAKAADNEQLSSGFSEHLEQTKEHASRLEKILSDHKQSTRGAKCKGMEGLIAEGEELLQERADPEVKDAGLISAAQRVEHYEIAGYGTALTYADMFGDKEGARLLKMTLNEEKETDHKLTKIAKSSVNVAAAC